MSAYLLTAGGNNRLNVLIKCLLLRRTKTQIDSAGKPLVKFNSILYYKLQRIDESLKIVVLLFPQYSYSILFKSDVLRNFVLVVIIHVL